MLSTSRPSRFELLMIKSMRAWHLVLLITLGVSLAPWTFAAGAHPPRSVQQPDLCNQNKYLRNSRGDMRGGQAVALPELVIVLAPEVRGGPLPRRFPKGSGLVRLEPHARSSHSLARGFFTAADPQTSFDGARILFAGQKAADSAWQIWEMNVDGTSVRQVTHCADDCLKPIYLPRGEIVFTATPQGPHDSQIWVCKADGSNSHPITFGPGGFQVETVLQNGAILASARSPLVPSNGLPADRHLYTLRPDGSGLATLRCDHQHPALRSQAKELADGTVVFVRAPLGSRDHGGDLTWIRRGALHNSPLMAAPVLTSSPQPINAGELLVARESTTSPHAVKKLTLYAFDTANGTFGAPLYEDPKLSSVEAIPVAAHEAPRWYWSTLNPELHRGYFICMDSYLADEFPPPADRGKDHSGSGTDARCRHPNGESFWEKPRWRKTARSISRFHLTSPSGLKLLDAAGRVVRAQRSWIWSRSGEEHGCVGCHEDRSVAPENRWPLALRRFDTPTLVLGSQQKAAGGKH